MLCDSSAPYLGLVVEHESGLLLGAEAEAGIKVVPEARDVAVVDVQVALA